MRPRGQLGARFVESDVSVRADAKQLQIDPARRIDFRLVALALGVQIAGRSVQEVNARRLEIDVAEQMLVHEPPEASGVICGYACELIEVEGPRAGEVDVARAMHPPQFGIGRYGTLPRRQAEHQVRLVFQRVSDAFRYR